MVAVESNCQKRFRYEVTAVSRDPKVINLFNEWMIAEHGQDVLSCKGCLEFRLIAIDEHTSRSEYLFTSEEAFQDYEVNDAPRLRQRGIEYFSGLDIQFSRASSSLIAEGRRTL